jgi:hypothetical protein
MQQKLKMQLKRKKTEILVTTKPENHYFHLNFYLKMITGKILPKKTPLASCMEHPVCLLVKIRQKEKLQIKIQKQSYFVRFLIAKSEGGNSKNCHISIFGY